MLKKTVAALERRGFEAVAVATRQEALELVLEEAGKAASVGWGGSETLKELGVREAVAALGREIRDHQLEMDLFLLSANALTADGRIVNIDGFNKVLDQDQYRCRFQVVRHRRQHIVVPFGINTLVDRFAVRRQQIRHATCQVRITFCRCVHCFP